jgi:NAD(P)-dependent dehydrogenase (short-subunit alcohol dehydrogenase family)
VNVLITGAASGIGAAAAKRLAGGWHPILADINGADAEELAARLRAEGHAATAIEVDVTRRASVANMMEQIGREVGQVHALFSNAGINRRKPVAEIGEEDWDAMMATHVKGTFLCAQAVLPAMCAAGRGVIVTTSSDFAIAGMPGAAAYATAKTAIYSLTKSLAVEFAPFGIRVNALGPGPIDTPLLRSGRSAEEWHDAELRLKARVAMGRLGQPAEIAAVLDYLLSDRASYMTGQIVHPNGGQLSW